MEDRNGEGNATPQTQQNDVTTARPNRACMTRGYDQLLELAEA
jgi:hypothetical protein